MIFGSLWFERLSDDVGGLLLHLHLRVISHEHHPRTRSKVLRSSSFISGISSLVAAVDSRHCEEVRCFFHVNMCISRGLLQVWTVQIVAVCVVACVTSLTSAFIKLVVMEMAGG